MPCHHSAKALPLASYTTSYEWYYQTKPVSQLSAGQLFGLPLLLEFSKQKSYLAVAEADLTDYAGMYLSRVEGEAGTFVSKLSPLPGQRNAR